MDLTIGHNDQPVGITYFRRDRFDQNLIQNGELLLHRFNRATMLQQISAALDRHSQERRRIAGLSRAKS